MIKGYRERPRTGLTARVSHRERSMDDVAAFNQARWRALAEADALYTRPALNLDPTSARERADPYGLLGPLDGKRVLCLAGGGGQQSAAFALLGARVTVVDLSDAQLERDAQVAAHYGVDLEIVQADMRDLSALAPDSFDLVQHAYSINFVPDVRVVFGQVARVIRPGGTYSLMFANPFVHSINPRSWDGDGYPLRRPYLDGEPIQAEDEVWVFRHGDDPAAPAPHPRTARVSPHPQYRRQRPRRARLHDPPAGGRRQHLPRPDANPVPGTTSLRSRRPG